MPGSKKIFWKLLVLALLLAVFFAWFFILGPSFDRPGSYYNKGENAVWLEHEWVERPKDGALVAGLVKKLSDNGIRYVYVHVGPLEADGGISSDRIGNVSQFIHDAKTLDPNIRYLAWIGQLRGKIAYENDHIRAKIAQTAAAFVKDFGFDGVHYDIEPILDDDDDFLLLLDETRSDLGQGPILSVALREILPSFTGKVIAYFYKLGDFNSPDFYQKVGDRVDQIAFMTYENTIKKPWLYQYFVKNEVIWATRLLHNVDVIIGLPTYDQASATFYPEAENVENGLMGVVKGLNNWRSKKENFTGVALYRYATTDDSEWAAYKKLWNNGN